MPLPVLTTTDDVLTLVKYLKNKPTGASTAEAGAAIGKKVLDGRKLAAYQSWGIATKDGDRLRLTELGWELARKPEQQAEILRRIMDSIGPYRSALEWVFHQDMVSVSNVDVAAHWHEHHSEALGTDNENTLKDNAVCFFHLCKGAGLGDLVIGRRGQPTRLELNQSELKAYVEGGPSTPPWAESERAGPGATNGGSPEPVTTVAQQEKPDVKLRVFVAHGQNMAIVEQVETMLDLADIQCEIAEKEETPAIPVPEKVFNAMRRCRAGVIVVSAEDGQRDAQGNYSINENVLIEVGAAFVLYEKRVVLLWDKRLPVPSNLQGLYRCDFEGNELSWSAGMKLMKAINGFKK